MLRIIRGIRKIFINLPWYKYVKDNKGDKKDTYQSTLVLAKIFQYLFVHQKDNLRKPLVKVKRSKEEM
jgi:hypothetical protein